MIDTKVGGTLNNKTPNWQVTRVKPTKIVGVYDANVVTMLASQVEALGRKIDALSIGKQVTLVMQCDVIEAGMISQECLPLKSKIEYEQVEFMDLRITLTEIPITQDGEIIQTFPRVAKGIKEHNPLLPHQQEKKPTIKDMMVKFISVLETRFHNTEAALRSQQTSI
ncbi:hypothetical protein EPI10_007548 [Gossypium australe]|uniref:Uncharacterized protein n=1 Tax=Gossypium australe TaxID=47621 RepID=A0A5B6WUK6_9ROSI|nr:hypothetical protein EPI10_007548 [Gossypium australe]